MAEEPDLLATGLEIEPQRERSGDEQGRKADRHPGPADPYRDHAGVDGMADARVDPRFDE